MFAVATVVSTRSPQYTNSISNSQFKLTSEPLAVVSLDVDEASGNLVIPFTRVTDVDTGGFLETSCACIL